MSTTPPRALILKAADAAIDRVLAGGPPSRRQELVYLGEWLATTAVSAILLAVARRLSRHTG